MDIKPNLGNTKAPGDFSVKEALAFKGREWQRIALTGRNLTRALPTIAGCFVATAFLLPVINYVSTSSIEGFDGKGGNILDIKTKYTNDDIEYTREFQRMLYMSESMDYLPKSSTDTAAFLQAHGEQVPKHATVLIPKFAPNHKYFGM